MLQFVNILAEKCRACTAHCETIMFCTGHVPLRYYVAKNYNRKLYLTSLNNQARKNLNCTFSGTPVCSTQVGGLSRWVRNRQRFRNQVFLLIFIHRVHKCNYNSVAKTTKNVLTIPEGDFNVPFIACPYCCS